MASVIRPLFHTSVAEGVYTEIVSRMSRYYYGSGYILPWPDESSPTTPSNTYEYELAARAELLTVNFISAGDVSFVVPRIDWTSGTVYDQYDDTYSSTNIAPSGAQTLKDAQFYVLTEDFNVYKCISNNYEASSTNKPTGTSTSVFSTSDGYLWKFMYTVPLALRNKFLNTDYMPVTRSVENGFYSDGAITNVTISNAGSGYVDGETTLNVSGDGTGADITLSVSSGGQIDSATIVDGGSGYTSLTTSVVGAGSDGEVTLTVSEGDLSTQQSNVELLAIDGGLHKIEITANGSGYSSSPTVTITGDGSNATATATVSSGEITNITITNPGSGYRTATITITDTTGVGATARAIISPIGGHGKDAIKELLADTLCFNVTLESTEYNGVALTNDNRQLCILKDIEEYDSGLRYGSATGTTAFTLEGSFTGTDFSADATITSGSKTLYVVTSIDDKMLAIAKDDSVPAVSDVFTDGTTSFTVTAVTDPDVNKYTGSIMFLDNRQSYDQAEAQFVNFKTFIKF